jgi:3-keto-disaccharide hydrolase
MRIVVSGLTLLVCLAASTATADDAFTPLFNGKDLEGWNGDPELWKVADGLIVGSTENKTLGHNSFLATKKTYKNFVLKAKFKLRNHNSGIQYRSKQGDDYVVTGYQADIADNAFMGILYEEGGRGILANVDAAEVTKHVNKDGWNEYVITANGPNLKQELNGFTTVDYTEKPDKGATEGIIAFQLHAGPKMQIEFKDVEIRELP